jgi:hypothetical protein
MSKSQKIFRYVWRINGVLILIAVGAGIIGMVGLLVDEFGGRLNRGREAKMGIQVADTNTQLLLEHATVIPGTRFMRANLTQPRGSEGFSSGGYSEIRNILFIVPGEKDARWLVPDDAHVITASSDIYDEKGQSARRMIATAVLLKESRDAHGTTNGTTKGELLLFDVTGKNIIEVASNVREMHVAALSDGELVLLYEREKRLVLAKFDPGSLARRGEQEINVPKIP